MKLTILILSVSWAITATIALVWAKLFPPVQCDGVLLCHDCSTELATEWHIIKYSETGKCTRCGKTSYPDGHLQ